MMTVTNEKLREMARAARELGMFDEETDPVHAIAKGLAYLAEDGDWDQEVIDSRLSSEDDWDGLEEWAMYLGS